MTHPVTSWIYDEARREVEADDVVKTASLKLPMLDNRQVDTFYKLAKLAELDKEATGAIASTIGKALKPLAPHMVGGGIIGAGAGALTDPENPMSGALKGAVVGTALGGGGKYLHGALKGGGAAAGTKKSVEEGVKRTGTITADRTRRLGRGYMYTPKTQNKEVAEELAKRTGGKMKTRFSLSPLGPKYTVSTKKPIHLPGMGTEGVNARSGMWHGRLAVASADSSALDKLAEAQANGYEIKNPMLKIAVSDILKEAQAGSLPGKP